MRSYPLSIDQIFDDVDGVSFVHNLVWGRSLLGILRNTTRGVGKLRL